LASHEPHRTAPAFQEWAVKTLGLTRRERYPVLVPFLYARFQGLVRRDGRLGWRAVRSENRPTSAAQLDIGRRRKPTSRFVNLEIRATEDPLVFFDVRIKDGLPCASPVQVYIEYAAGDKRDQETAVQVRERLLADLS